LIGLYIILVGHDIIGLFHTYSSYQGMHARWNKHTRRRPADDDLFGQDGDADRSRENARRILENPVLWQRLDIEVEPSTAFEPRLHQQQLRNFRAMPDTRSSIR
jgi:hypothetical protein